MKWFKMLVRMWSQEKEVWRQCDWCKKSLFFPHQLCFVGPWICCAVCEQEMYKDADRILRH